MGQTSIVFINANSSIFLTWQNRSDLEREMLVYHELGHCLLNRTHVYDVFHTPGNIEIIDSVMFPPLPYGPDYANYRDHYMEELFK